MKNDKSFGKCNILKYAQDDENIHFCQDREHKLVNLLLRKLNLVNLM